MPNKRNKQKLPEAPPPDPPNQSVLPDDGVDDDEFYTIDLAEVRKDVQCAICLGIIRKTRAVMECMHRFCKDCIEKSFRLGKNECPTCRTHCSSRRSLREDPRFDALIALLYPNIAEYEDEELAISNDTTESLQKMQKSYTRTSSKRQSAALGKKCSVAAFLKRSKGKYLRSSNLRRRRNFKNITENLESSSSNGRDLARIAEEREVEVIHDTDTSDGETENQCPQNVTKALVIGEGTSHDMSEAEIDTQSNKTNEVVQSPQHVTNNAIVIVITNETIQRSVPQPELMRGIFSSSDKLSWGRNGRRSSSYNSARSHRLARLIDHLRISEPTDDELDIFIKLVSFEEERVPNVSRPYLNCKPTLSVKQLCQYVANETSLQAEEIELYIIKECQPEIVSGGGKLDPNNHKIKLLATEEETLAELKDNLNFGYLVIAYKRKRWNLNEALS